MKPDYDEHQDRVGLMKMTRRPWAAEMVVIPKALALDLVHSFCNHGCFVAELTDEQCEAGDSDAYAERHRVRMADLEDLALDRVCESGLNPTAENMLAMLAMIYEAAALTKAS